MLDFARPEVDCVATGRAVLLRTLLAALPPRRAPSRGRVELVEKGGRPASDLSDVVVYLDGAKAKAEPATARGDEGQELHPRAWWWCPWAATVDFPNEDPIFHNVFSVSGENRFDLELYKRPKSGLVDLPAPRAWRASTATSTRR